MAFPLRRTRRLVTSVIRVLVLLIVISGIATLIGHMYMLNDEYANQLSEKRLSNLISEAREGQRIDDVKNAMQQAALDLRWPGTTERPKMKSLDFVKNMERFEDDDEEDDEGEEEQFEQPTMSESEMDEKLLEDELNDWFGVTTTGDQTSVFTRPTTTDFETTVASTPAPMISDADYSENSVNSFDNDDELDDNTGVNYDNENANYDNQDGVDTEDDGNKNPDAKFDTENNNYENDNDIDEYENKEDNFDNENENYDNEGDDYDNQDSNFDNQGGSFDNDENENDNFANQIANYEKQVLNYNPGGNDEDEDENFDNQIGTYGRQDASSDNQDGDSYHQNGDFDNQDGGLDDQDVDFDNQAGGFDNQDGGFDNQDGGFDNQAGGFDNQDGGFDNQDGDFDNQAGGFDNQDGGFDNQDGDFDNQGGDSYHQDADFDNEDGGFDNQDDGFGNQDGGFDNEDGGFDNKDGDFDNQGGDSYRQDTDFDNEDGDFDNQDGDFDDQDHDFDSQNGGSDNQDDDSYEQDGGFDNQDEEYGNQDGGSEKQESSYDIQDKQSLGEPIETATESSFGSEVTTSLYSESNTAYDGDWEYSFDQNTQMSVEPQDALTDQTGTTETSPMMFTYHSIDTQAPESERHLGSDADDEEQEVDTMEYPANENEGEMNYPGPDDVDENDYEEEDGDSYENDEDNVSDENTLRFTETGEGQTEEDSQWKAPPMAEPMPNLPSNVVDRPQYILPVFRGIGQGPNNQYLAFKAVVLYAMMHNKTIVLPPFFNHHRITEDDVRTFEETFNANLLGGVVRIATLDEFRQACDNKVDAVLYTKPCVNPRTCYFDSIYRTMIPIFEILTGIKFPSKESFDIDEQSKMPITMLPTDPAIFTQNSIYEYLDTIKDTFRTDVECAAMFYPFPFMKLMMRAYSDDTYAKLEQHLARALYIRQMADHFIRTTMENRPFMAVHWRLNYDFKIVWCGRRVECRWGCQYIYKRNSTDDITAYFVNIMQAFNLSAIYFASPPMQKQKVWDNVRTRIPYAFNASSLITSLQDLHIPELTTPLEEDNYVISLIEQELCYRASMFIGTAVSTWSYMVEQQRLGKGTLFMPDVFGDPEGKCR